MTTPEKLAGQCAYPTGAEGDPGLTKREYFAGLAMQGLLSNWEALIRMGFRANEVEKFAIERADGLLKELAK